MRANPSVPDHSALYRIAERQAGYFTAQQAQSVGFSRPLLSHHVQGGRYMRVGHGIYRLAHFPESSHADLFVAALRLKGRGTFSHETALALYELSDVMPARIHVTVPRSVSRRRDGIKLYTKRLSQSEITERAGLPVTAVPRTLADVIVGGMPQELAAVAVRQALERGLVSEAELVRYATQRGGRMAKLVAEATRNETAR